ncbi:hypothetical protein BJ875DRAFT_444404 [Amylocarpus encephaloides]|uniref:Uncharacterized protein n=1 Tax=Amylocarpus encephaloides TaxID=45428 RepID=A0A9P7YDB2_9HELO|nr:hypothetical protein BJ875DRAFT_444404 [Amylocarpus encephaloides]
MPQMVLRRAGAKVVILIPMSRGQSADTSSASSRLMSSPCRLPCGVSFRSTFTVSSTTNTDSSTGKDDFSRGPGTRGRSLPRPPHPPSVGNRIPPTAHTINIPVPYA